MQLGSTVTCIILSVDPDAAPDSVREPAGTTITTVGFEIEWNVPEPREFIVRYEITITEQARRSRRNEPMKYMYNVSGNENSFPFTTGKPFTEYSVEVDALLDVNGVSGSVPALLPITLQTAQGSELALGQNS